MFISKWRYEKNLEDARNEGMKKGIREGRREANEQKFDYIEYLEKENKALKDKLAAEQENRKADAIEIAAKMGEDAKAQMNKSLINALALELAQWQKMADIAYYINGSQVESSSLLDKAFVIKELASKMGICGNVYARAYEIYDFRNSGKEGYTLKDGKIVKVEQAEELPQTPFAEEQEAKSAVCDAPCGYENEAVPGQDAKEPAWVDPDSCTAVREAPDEEAPF